jgi:hypothetical protein
LNFVGKLAPNRPKADKRGFYVSNLLKNEPPIGQRPIKRGFYAFYSILLKNEPQIGRKPIKGELCFKFVKK